MHSDIKSKYIKPILTGQSENNISSILNSIYIFITINNFPTTNTFNSIFNICNISKTKAFKITIGTCF